ncbi:synemin [Takifugu flavidus]|uniref:synemin n=1 Tax=Takifugu flavidus TaxID=433684 RepID=UPI002544CD15|nr:synemin [Takifugu flavidus]
MLPFNRTFEGEKQQLRELNSRLVQYLSRTKQLEKENVHLIAEINKLREAKAAEWEPNYKDEMRDLRRMVAQLSFEKSQAELEREKLWRELQMVQGLCSEQTEVCRDISGELKGCEQELHRAHNTNDQLQQRLFQLENERKRLEEAHRQEMHHLRVKVESRVVPVVTQTYRGPPAASTEEMHEYARDLSEGWIHTFEMYQRKVEEMEQGIREDRAMLCDLQREKMLYASELDKMRAEAEKQGQVQLRLEEQLMHMQDRFRTDCGEYQMIIEQLEEERKAMADTIAERMREHQQLLQVKMDLGMEVSAYRALLEGERMGLQDANRRMNPQQRERVIDIRLPAQPYTQRTSAVSSRHRVDTRYSAPMSNLRRSPVPPSGSRSPSRVIPISVAGRAQHQSPASRRDMVSFAKARADASSAASAARKGTDKAGENTSEEAGGDQVVKVKKAHQENQVSPIKSPPAEAKTVASAQVKSMITSAEGEAQAPSQPERDNNSTDMEKPEVPSGPNEKKALDSVSVEELIEKVIKPAGLEAKVGSSGDAKLTYHVEKTEQEDGTTKTQIVLESKVEEELDFSKDATLDGLLHQGVKKVSLEDIEDTATGSMIKDLLSGLRGSGELENRSVNVEIIEEPVEALSEEETDIEQHVRGDLYEPPARYFQIEELENVSEGVPSPRSADDTTRPPEENAQVRSVQVQEVSSKSESSYFSHDQEPREYFVSTPDDNLFEHEEGITSYGHYGVVDDLSDERYYQDQDRDLFPRKVIVEESEECAFLPGGHAFPSEGFQPRECIIEEEVRISPVVQESMLEFLKEDSLEPKEQLKGALEKLQSSVSGPLREELAFLTRVSSNSPQNVAVDVRKVQQSSDNGTTTIVAELNVSQTLEDSGLLEGGEDLSEEQIMAALRASDLGLEKGFQGGAGGGYTFKISKEENRTYSDGGFSSEGETAPETSKSERSATLGTPVKITQEQRIATVYLESPTDD